MYAIRNRQKYWTGGTSVPHFEAANLNTQDGRFVVALPRGTQKFETFWNAHRALELMQDSVVPAHKRIVKNAYVVSLDTVPSLAVA